MRWRATSTWCSSSWRRCKGRRRARPGRRWSCRNADAQDRLAGAISNTRRRELRAAHSRPARNAARGSSASPGGATRPMLRWRRDARVFKSRSRGERVARGGDRQCAHECAVCARHPRGGRRWRLGTPGGHRRRRAGNPWRRDPGISGDRTCADPACRCRRRCRAGAHGARRQRIAADPDRAARSVSHPGLRQRPCRARVGHVLGGLPAQVTGSIRVPRISRPPCPPTSKRS